MPKDPEHETEYDDRRVPKRDVPVKKEPEQSGTKPQTQEEVPQEDAD